MASIKKIIVAVDLSKYAQPVLRFGCQLARDLGADLLPAAAIDQRVVDALQMMIKRHSGPPVETFVNEKKLG